MRSPIGAIRGISPDRRAAMFVAATGVWLIVEYKCFPQGGRVYPVGLLLAVAVAEWLAHLFTVALRPVELTRIVRLAYRLGAIVLLASIAPFFFSVNSSEERFGTGMFILVKGCVESARTQPSPSLDLQCEQGRGSQWVVSIGADVAPRETEVAHQAIREGAASLSAGAANEEPASSEETPEQLASSPDLTESGYLLRGGLTVPLYFIVLAVFGGAVNLLRRVPEYQRRADDEYRKEFEKLSLRRTEQPTEPRPPTPPPLDPMAAREYLVFQIMQLISSLPSGWSRTR